MAVSILESLAEQAAASIPDNSGRELRAAPRVAVRLPVSAGPEGNARRSSIVDLSATGCAVAWAAEVDLGEVFEVSFQLPDADATDIQCVGLVRSFRKTEMGRVIGLEFHNLASEGRRAVAAHVRATLAGEAPSEARRHWAAAPDLGAAQMVPSEEKNRPVLRWAPGFLDLYCARRLGARVESFENIYDGHKATQHTIGTATPPQGGVDHFDITATYHGPAFQISDMKGVLHSKLLLAHTPIDEEHLDLRFAVMLEKSGPRTAEFAQFYVDNLRMGFHEDISIWEHKVFREKPFIVAGDGPIGRLRTWYRQFFKPGQTDAGTPQA